MIVNGIEVREDMLEATKGFGLGHETRAKMLSLALKCLSENPIAPTTGDVMDILQKRVQSGHISSTEYCVIPPATVRFVICEWQRRMLLAPKTEVIPDEIKGLLWERLVGTPLNSCITLGIAKDHDRDLIEAFYRGQNSL